MLTALFTRRMLICVFTGFSSGLPLYLRQRRDKRLKHRT